jgi:asparagine synthase (glutamine-hydrolysing)
MLQQAGRWAALASLRRFLGIGSPLPTAPGRRLSRILDLFEIEDDAERMAYLLTVETRREPPDRLLAPAWRERLRQSDPFARYREMNRRFARLELSQKMIYADTTILLPDLFLEKVDKSTMASGIESRVPLLDQELADYVIGLPVALKLRHGQKKALLRAALRGVLPDDILDGKKTGFGVPYQYWLRVPLHEFVRETLLGTATRKHGFFDFATLEKCLDEHRAGTRDHWFILWKLLCFVLWHSQYFEHRLN